MVRGLLSKHIDGGFINVKKKNSNEEKKLTPSLKNYSNYLKNGNSKNKVKTNVNVNEIKLNVIKKDKKQSDKKQSNKKKPEKIIKKNLPKPVSQNIVSKPQKQVQESIAIKKKNSKRSSKRVSRKSKKRPTKRRKTLHKRHTKSRRISFRCYPQKDNVNIEKMLKKVEKMSDENIKTELLKNGIEIKTNNNKLLKDMYMFSNMGGIRINKE